MQLVGDRVSMLDTMKNRPHRPRPGDREVRRRRPTRWSTSRPCAATASTMCPARPASASRPPPLLINEYGDLDTLLARAGEIKQDKRRETLIDFADQIRLSRELVRAGLRHPAARADRRPAVRDPDPEALAAFLEQMEFRTLARRVGDGKAAGHGGSAFAPKPTPAPVASRATRRAAPPPPAEARPSTPTPMTASATSRRSTPGSPGRPRPGWSPSTPRPTPCPRPHAGLCGVSLAIGAGRGLLHPVGHERGRGGRRPGLRRRRPTSTRSRWTTAIARLKPLLEDPGRPQGGPERQIRHGRPGALRHPRRADRRHHADLLCAGGRAARPRHGRAVAGCGSATSRSRSRPVAGDRQGAEELQTRRR